MKYNKNEVTGKMRDRIILQNVTRVRSLSGFASESWADIATIWAFAESKLPGSNETIIDGKNTAKNVCDFTIRYISTITEESRVVWGDKLYQVKNLKVSHDRRFISFTGVFYDSYILTGVNVAASVNGIATTSANLKLIMSVIGQANAIASSFADLTVFQQGTVDVAASVNALGTSTANLTKVININSSVDATANVSAPITISKNISSSVDATATSVGDVQLVKLLSASVNANATATSILDVVTQGIVLVDASVTATGETTANLTRIVTLESSSTTAAETSATAILTKVLEANATASAQTSADAQITIPVNASATATAETSANAQLTYTVNASANASAQTSAEAQIVRIISAEATAMAESSAEASFGVTFIASVNGTATVTNASVSRTATLAASVTGAATVTSATLDVAQVDPNFANVSLLLHGNGTNGSTTFIDNSLNNFTLTRGGNTVISTAQSKFGGASILFDGNGDNLNIPSDVDFAFGTNDFTIEFFVRFNFVNKEQVIFDFRTNNTGASLSPVLALNTSGQFYYFFNGAIQITTSAVTSNVFHHIALVRNAGNTRIYINGSQSGTTYVNSSSLIQDGVVLGLNRNNVGVPSNFFNLDGYLDEFRITKGVARYTGTTLTVPTAQFPDQ